MTSISASVEEGGNEGQLTEEIVFGRSPLAMLPMVICAILLALVAAYATARFPWSVQMVSVLGVSMKLPLFALVPLILGVLAIRDLYDARYIIGADHVRAIDGIISFRKNDSRVEFEHIRGIEVDRSLWGRLVNVGELRIGTAMAAEVEIIIRGVQNPSLYRDIILTRCKRCSGSTSDE